MSIQANIATLKTLQVVDARILSMRTELTEERSNMDEKSETHVGLVTTIANLEGIVESMESTRGELNGELKQHNAQIEKSREKMARCRNEKEANAAQREMEEIRRLCRDREHEITKLAGLMEDAAADLAKVEEERVAIASQIDDSQGAQVSRVRELEESLEVQLKKRATALDALTALMKRRYEAVAKVRGSGSAAVVKGGCAACHIELSPRLFQEVMRLTELHQCPSCMRFLYYEEPATLAEIEAKEKADAEAEADAEALKESSDEGASDS